MSTSDYTKGIDETEELRASKLSQLAKAVAALDQAKTQNYRDAQSKCPHLLDNKFLLMFLRCERWDVDLASLRLAKYWDERVELFGHKAFLPLTPGEALRDDGTAASLGIFNALPGRDEEGRSIIWVDASSFPSATSDTPTHESICRYMWYVFHTALENEDAQKHGVVTLFFNSSPMKLNQFDRKRMEVIVRSIKGCLPVRLKALHLCQPPGWFAFAFPVIKVFLGGRLLRRVSMHKGSTNDVINALNACGLSSVVLPECLGGGYNYNRDEWYNHNGIQAS